MLVFSSDVWEVSEYSADDDVEGNKRMDKGTVVIGARERKVVECEDELEEKSECWYVKVKLFLFVYIQQK